MMSKRDLELYDDCSSERSGIPRSTAFRVSAIDGRHKGLPMMYLYEWCKCVLEKWRVIMYVHLLVPRSFVVSSHTRASKLAFSPRVIHFDLTCRGSEFSVRSLATLDNVCCMSLVLVRRGLNSFRCIIFGSRRET